MKEFFEFLCKRRIVFIASLLFFLFIIIAFIGPYIAPYNPYEADFSKTFQSPSMQHLLGTDWAGRDIFSRILVGARISLRIGVLALLLGAGVGGFIGVISGYFGGRFEFIIMRITDIWLCFPFLIVAILITAILGPGLNNAIIAIGVARIPRDIRLMRSATISVKEDEFVVAAKALGGSSRGIIFYHIFPNVIQPFIINATLNLGLTLISEATLSFIGLGAQAPLPSWGLMVRQASENIFAFPFGIYPPVFAILLVVLSVNLLGDGLREYLDPKQA